MKKNAILFMVLSIIIIGCKKDNDPKTGPANFIINTEQATNITNNNAVVHGSISNLNGTSILNYGHVWSTQQSPNIELETKTVNSSINSDTSFISKITNLKKNTTYYVRPYAVDNNGVYYGPEISFGTNSQFFKFVVSSNYMLFHESTRKRRTWVLIYTDDGQFIDFQEMFNGVIYEFAWPVNPSSDKYNIQIFKEYISDHIDSSYRAEYDIDCYLSISPTTWNLGYEEEEPLVPIGTNIVTIDNYMWPDYYQYIAKNKYSYADYSYADNKFQFDQYFNPDNIYFMYMYENQAPFYKWFDNVGLNESFAFSADEFIEMTDYVDFEFPNNNGRIMYVESEDDLSTDVWEYYGILNYYDNGLVFSGKKIYYPTNLFDGYFTYFKTKHDQGSELMLKSRGTIPTQFISLNTDIIVNNSSFFNYDIDIINDADVIYLGFDYSDYIGVDYTQFHYGIHGSKNAISSYSTDELPSEVSDLTDYFFDFSKLKYSGASFKEYDNIISFEDYINNAFVFPNTGSPDYTLYLSKSIPTDSKKSGPVVDIHEEIRNLKRNPYFK